MKYLTDSELRDGAARTDEQWRVTEWGSAAQGGTPGSLTGEKASRGSLDHLDGGGPLSIMLPRTSNRTPAPRRDAPLGSLSVVTTPPEPTYAELRSRLLLALALVNHRRNECGLSPEDTATVHAALRGEWDAA